MTERASEANTRWIILDTETTGTDPAAGHRVVEIGCVEIIDRRKSGRNFHAYLNPDRDSEEGALRVHGLTSEFLADKPRFAEIADKFLAYLEIDARPEVIIHNAAFDLGFLDAEFARLGRINEAFSDALAVTDSLQVARERHPGQANSLNALCKRYSVDASARSLHGALLDAELLADVYLALTAGQAALSFDLGGETVTSQLSRATRQLPRRRIEVSEEELQAHARRLDRLSEISGADCLWRQLPSA